MQKMSAFRATALAAAIFVSGCGLSISHPTAEKNLPVVHRGEIVNEAGTPLQDAKVRVTYTRVDWNFALGTGYPESHMDLIANGNYEFTVNGAAAGYTRIRIEKPGYLPFDMVAGYDALLFEVPYEGAGPTHSALTYDDIKKSFRAIGDAKPGDTLRIVMRPEGATAPPLIPTIIRRRPAPSSAP